MLLPKRIVGVSLLVIDALVFVSGLAANTVHMLMKKCIHWSQTLFGNEHAANTPREHFFISENGGGAEGAAPFWDLSRRACSAWSQRVLF